MSVVTVTGEPFGGDREFARLLAQRLNYRCIEPETVIERAALTGSLQQELKEALEKPLSMSQCLLHTSRVPFRLLQAALAEGIREGNAVCYGNLAHLLPQSKGQIRIRLVQKQERRIEAAGEGGKFDRAEAAARVCRSDQDARAWLRYVYIAKFADRVREDITLALSEDIRTACLEVAQKIREREAAKPEDADITIFEDFVVSALGRAALTVDLATAQLDLDVHAQAGRVSVTGTASVQELGEIRRVLMEVKGVNEVDIKGVSSLPTVKPAMSANTLETTRAFIERRFLRACMAGAVAVAMIAAAVLSGALRRVGVQNISGIITDTKCAGSHSAPGTDPTVCVRECIHNNKGISYALYDGKRMYILADQAAGAIFAGHKVVITGPEVDKKSGRLRMDSIKDL
jgi:hypothetical protein